MGSYICVRLSLPLANEIGPASSEMCSQLVGFVTAADVVVPSSTYMNHNITEVSQTSTTRIGSERDADEIQISHEVVLARHMPILL